MKNKRIFSIAIATSILIGLSALGVFRYLSPTAKAFNPQPDPPGFGMLGITPGQTLRVSVVNTANPSEPNTPPDPCRVVIAFRDSDGNLIRNLSGQPIRRIVQLKSGEATHLDLNADDFPTTVGGLRLDVRPDVRIQRPDGNGGTPPDPIIPTVEVINNANGRTQFLVTPVSAVQRTASTPQ